MDFSKLSGGLLVKGLLPFFVLKLLDSASPMYGSEIRDAIAELTGGRWRPSPGALYPLLVRLSGFGLVRAEPGRRGGRPVRRYTLTERGRRELQGFLTEIHPRLEATVRLLQVHLRGLEATHLHGADRGEQRPPGGA